MAKKDFTTPLSLNGQYPNLDDRYTNNGDPYVSKNAAETALASKLNAYHIGLTVLVKESGWTEAKEYWVQPYDNNGVTAYHLVEKGAGTTDYAALDNKPTISDGGQGSAQIPLLGNVKVTATAAASGQTTGVAVTAENGGITMAFTLEKGADGVNGTNGTNGIDGKSAFEVWKETTGRTTANEADYIADLQTKVAKWIPVAYEALSPAPSIGDAVTITNPPSTPIDGAIVIMPNAASSATATMMFAVSEDPNTQGSYIYTYIGDLNVDTTGLLGIGDVDGTGLANPAPNALAKAEDVKGKTDRLEAQVGHGTSTAVYEDIALGSWTDGKAVSANSGQPWSTEGKSVAGYSSPIPLDGSYKGKTLRYTRPVVAAATESGLAFYETTSLSSFISGEAWLVDSEAAGTLVETDIVIPQNASYVKFTCPTELKDQFFAKVKVSELYNYSDGLGKQVAENTQAIEDLQNAERNVSMEDTDFLVNVKSVNLFNGDYEVGSYRVGGKSSVSGYNCTLPMWLEAGKTYKWKKVSALGGNSKYVGVYGSGEEPEYSGVQAGVDNSDGFILFTPNADGWFAMNIGGSVSSFMVCEESEYPDTYVPYEDKWTFPELTVLPQNVADLLRGLTANPLYGKKVVFDGDSICAASRDTAAEKGWAGRIGAGNNMAWANKAVSGGTITSGVYVYAKWVNGSDAVYTQNKHITAGETYCYTNSNRTEGAVLIDSYDTAADAITAGGVVYTYSDSGSSKRHWISSYIDTIISQYETLDYLIFEGGANDALLSGISIGPDRDAAWKRNYTGPFDDNTFVGALDSLFYKAITAYPNAVIGFIVAQKQFAPGSSNYNSMVRFYGIAKEVCEKWGVRCIDLWNDCPMNPGLAVYATAYDSEGQHPTTIGYDIIVPIIERWMRGL